MIAILLILNLVRVISSDEPCPLRCECNRSGSQREWLKVKCEHLQELSDIDLNPVSVATIKLDLSNNEIYVIKPGIFRNLTNLKRLDLSNNKITMLDQGSFDGLENLKNLYLSKNQITSVDSRAFQRLSNLQTLKLNGNKIVSLKDGVFRDLEALKQLDISGNPWDCDCNLYWFSWWSRNGSVKLNPAPKCETPLNLHGELIKDLRFQLKDSDCEWSTPSIEIIPNQNQVVFAGDAITLKCRAPSIANNKDVTLNWLWYSNVTTETLNLSLYKNPEISLPDIQVENRYLPDTGIVDSSLSIVTVNEEHNGQWNCLLVSAYGNASKAINVIVISNQTRYCPLAVTKNNKGMYAWPKTVVGWKVELLCEGLPTTSLQLPPRASYMCNADGQWEDLSTESCPYVSKTTKILEQFSKVNLSLTKSTLLETMKKFKNYTSDGTILTDPVEVHFITQTLENYAGFLEEEKELGPMIVDVINSLLNLPKPMLKSAEASYQSCTKLVQIVELVTKFSPSIQSYKKNLALQEIRVRGPENFAGLTCSWHRNKEESNFGCSTDNLTAFADTVEASVQLPASLFRAAKKTAAVQQLMISMYSDNRLFPKMDAGPIDISSSVVGTKAIGTTIANLSDPVYIIVRAPLYHRTGSIPQPVVWDPLKNNNTGGWTSNGCQLSTLHRNLIIFHCDRLGYYGLLQNRSILELDGKSTPGAKFKFSNPAIYVGSLITASCLIFITVTYVRCYAFIVMPKKAKHCIINTWVAMALLCFLYTSGIRQTENPEICQGIGLTLHYLSLCCLLWMAAYACNMYKRLTKSSINTITDDDELHDQPIRKPLLGLYLVGWGIALIICGISGAINLQEYAGYSQCFLTSGPALGSLFFPSAVILAYTVVVHMLIRCTIRNVDLNGQLSEGTQATENMDLELLEPNANPVTTDRASLNSSQTVSSEMEDQEHSQMTQLKGSIVVMILYLMSWLSAALTTANLSSYYIPNKETLFATLYAISSGSLSMFIILFYGIARSDVRAQWMQMRCWLKRKKNRCCRTRSVSDAAPAIPAQPLVPGLPAPQPMCNSQATQVTSDANSIISSGNTNKSRDSYNATKLAAVVAAVAEETERRRVQINHGTNANLVTLHRQQYRSNNSMSTFNTESASNCVEMFYNPHQSGVARKFFKKQRRHMMKNNNLGPRKQGDGGATSDGGSCVSIPRPAMRLENNIERNIFVGGTKVNNTNIHIEMNPVSDMKNVNILSDSGGSVTEDRNLAIRYVIGQENLRKHDGKVNKDSTLDTSIRGSSRRRPLPPVNQIPYTSPYASDTTESKVEEEERYLRNVSQQCSLECSSEMESITQIADISERSECNLPDIGEITQSTEEIARHYSTDEMDRKLSRPLDRSSRSGSLYSLPPTDRSISSRGKSCRSSLNETKRRDSRDSRQILSECNANFDSPEREDVSVSIPLVEDSPDVSEDYDINKENETSASTVAKDFQVTHFNKECSEGDEDDDDVELSNVKKETSV